MGTLQERFWSTRTRDTLMFDGDTRRGYHITQLLESMDPKYLDTTQRQNRSATATSPHPTIYLITMALELVVHGDGAAGSSIQVVRKHIQNSNENELSILASSSNVLRRQQKESGMPRKQNPMTLEKPSNSNYGLVSTQKISNLSTTQCWFTQ